MRSAFLQLSFREFLLKFVNKMERDFFFVVRNDSLYVMRVNFP